jgi:hypothetical protein
MVRILEQDIGGVFALGGYPIVGHGLEQIAEERIDLLGISGQQPRPIQRRKSVRQFLCLCEVCDPDEGVFELPVTDALLIQFPRQPLMSRSRTPGPEGETPGLEPDVNQAEVAIHKIEVQK